jgi:hypothetical protein
VVVSSDGSMRFFIVTHSLQRACHEPVSERESQQTPLKSRDPIKAM